MAIVEFPSQRTTTRVRGLAPWQPQHATLALLETIRAVLAEYAGYLPLTLRQVFYRLVGAHGYDKTERAYARLGECLNRARRAGLICFDAIRDDDAEIHTATGWGSPGELIETWLAEASHFRLDRQQGQPRRVLVMVEARGMKPQIETATEDYGVPVIGSGGFDSLTAKYQLAGNLGRRGGLTEVLHIGDHDPSGVHLFSSMADDVAALIRDRGLPGRVLFTRLAVTPAQIVELGLPTAPPKETDRRSFEGDTVQAEAIPPDVLAQIVADAIHERLDRAAYQSVLVRERRIRRDLSERLRSLLNGDAS
jgi:hypothetical protein